jgi:hypothetical protein
MAARSWSRMIATAVCTECPWRRASNAARPRSPEFVVRDARRHAQVTGHEVECGHQKFVTYGGRRPRAARAQGVGV